MPDAIEQYRAETEAELTALLRKLNARHRKSVLLAVERYGSAAAVPDSFWENLKREVDQESAALMLLLLMNTYRHDATQLDRQARQLAPGRDAFPLADDPLRTRAATTAATLGRSVADDYVDGVRQRLVNKVDGQIPALNLRPPREAAAEVRQTVADVMDDDQIERVVSTRTTQGISAAQGSAASDVGRHYGLAIDVAWRTKRDTGVCPVCEPLDGRPSIEWVDKFPNGPPGHPRCRCRLVSYFPAGVN